MSRDVEPLREQRASKIWQRIKRDKLSPVPMEFILKHCNTAKWGKFNTAEDTLRVVNLYLKETNMTTKETNTGNTVADLTNAVTVYRQGEQQAVVNYNNAVQKMEDLRVAMEDVKAKHADAKVALGKAKLAEAIALIDKVHAEAPKGSAAAKDIENLLERILQQRLMNAIKGLPYVSPFAVTGTVTGRISSAEPTTQERVQMGAETTAAAKAETSVSGGGHQAKPTAPYVPKVGDKVRFIKPWWDGSHQFVGKDLTVSKVMAGRYVYFKEMDHAGANTRVDNVVPAPTSSPCNYPNRACVGSQFCGVKA